MSSLTLYITREETAFLFKCCVFFLFICFFVFRSHNEIYNTRCAPTPPRAGNLRRYAPVCLLEAPFTRGTFQGPWHANNKSINHILCTSNLVDVIQSLLLAIGLQPESEKEARQQNAFSNSWGHIESAPTPPPSKRRRKKQIMQHFMGIIWITDALFN